MSVARKTRVIFMGTPPFAAKVLAALHSVEHLEIVAVYSQPPRPANRGKKINHSAVQKLAETLGLDVFHPSNFKSNADVEQFKKLNADVAVVAAYGLILPAPILNAPKLHCVNIHPSLLPRWRGAAPIQRTIEAGDTHTGVCLIQMDQGLDTGDIIWERTIAITPEHDTPNLHDALATMGGQMIIELLTAYPNGGWPTNPQPSVGVTYALKIDKAEARLDWQEPADILARKVKAFIPFPGAFFELPNNQERIKVLEAHAVAPVNDQSPPPLPLSPTSSADVPSPSADVPSPSPDVPSPSPDVPSPSPDVPSPSPDVPSPSPDVPSPSPDVPSPSPDVPSPSPDVPSPSPDVPSPSPDVPSPSTDVPSPSPDVPSPSPDVPSPSPDVPSPSPDVPSPSPDVPSPSPDVPSPSPDVPSPSPGTIANNDGTLDIFCANGSILSVRRAQRAGKMAMPIADLLCGLELNVGETLGTGKHENDAF